MPPPGCDDAVWGAWQARRFGEAALRALVGSLYAQLRARGLVPIELMPEYRKRGLIGGALPSLSDDEPKRRHAKGN